MKIFRITRIGATALLCLVLLNGCKKKEEADPDENGQSAIDSREAQGENDLAVNDVNDVVGNEARLHGKSGSMGAQGITGSICGLSIDTAAISAGSLKLNYDGTTCNNRTRTGSIMLTLQDYATGMRWKKPGAIIKVEYLNYKVTRASDGKSIMLNGIQYLTNVSGGTWWELLIVKTQSNLVTTVTGTGLNVTFSDGKTAVYNINRRFTYTYPNNVITCTGEGIGAANGLTGLENYGTTREGEYFTSQVAGPILWNLTCGPGAPVKGEVIIKVDSKSFELRCLFGVDSSGDPINVGPNQCAYGWKLDWTYKNKNHSKVIGYN